MAIPISNATAEWDAAEYVKHSSLQEAMADEVLALLLLQGNERVLDVGCGDGRVTVRIAQRLNEGSIVGVDSSTRMIQFATERYPSASYPHLHFAVLDARELNYQQEFDLVFSSNALHWIPQQEAVLNNIRTALKPDGRAQLRMVCAGDRKSLEAVVEETRKAPRWMSFFDRFQDPYLRLRPTEYAQLAATSGFEVERLQVHSKAWDFGSREAFAAFATVGLVAWTQQIPDEQKAEFIADVLNRYQAAIPNASPSVFQFYQMDVTLKPSDPALNP